MIGIVNYGLGNLGSIHNMLKRIGADAAIVETPEELGKCNKIILPGVGAFDTGMQNLENKNLLPKLNEMVLQEKKPILGICLGMQLMTEKSEEGIKKGLGYIGGTVNKFQFADTSTLKIPHMGWNIAHIAKNSKLTTDFKEEVRFYFVHTYHVKLNTSSDQLLTCNYGYEFAAAFEHENILGVQFHPEKSHKFGMKLLENFVLNY